METHGAKAQIVENSVLIVLVPISRPSDNISGGSLFFRIMGYGLSPRLVIELKIIVYVLVSTILKIF